MWDGWVQLWGPPPPVSHWLLLQSIGIAIGLAWCCGCASRNGYRSLVQNACIARKTNVGCKQAGMMPIEHRSARHSEFKQVRYAKV